MGKYSPLNRFKKACKKISKNTGISLAEAHSQEAQNAGYTHFHDLQVCAKKNPHDQRLLEYVFGDYGFDGNEILARELLSTILNDYLLNVLSGEIASTNATDFYLDHFEIDSEEYDDNDGSLTLKGTAIVSGTLQDDRPYYGSQLYAYMTVNLIYCDEERAWLLRGLPYEATKIEHVSNDMDEDPEPLLYLSI